MVGVTRIERCNRQKRVRPGDDPNLGDFYVFVGEMYISRETPVIRSDSVVVYESASSCWGTR